MDGSAQPAAHLVHGLRRLVDDIRRLETRPCGGLNGIVCGETELMSFSDSSILYCGHRVEQLVDCHSFERIIWLLLNGSLPTEEELADCCSIMADSAVIDQSTTEILARIPLGARPLDLFPLCLSLLSFFDPTPQDTSTDSARSRVWRLLAQLPLIISAGLGEDAKASGRCPTELSADETELSRTKFTPTISGEAIRLAFFISQAPSFS